MTDKQKHHLVNLRAHLRAAHQHAFVDEHSAFPNPKLCNKLVRKAQQAIIEAENKYNA
jgi:hypothetical protein